jgi:hypothetical protein
MCFNWIGPERYRGPDLYEDDVAEGRCEMCDSTTYNGECERGCRKCGYCEQETDGGDFVKIGKETMCKACAADI